MIATPELTNNAMRSGIKSVLDIIRYRYCDSRSRTDSME